MEESSERGHPDIITIRIIEPKKINILVTKNFTLGMLKYMIHSLLGFDTDEIKLEVVGG